MDPNFLLTGLVLSDNLYLIWLLVLKSPDYFWFVSKTNLWCKLTMYWISSLEFASNWLAVAYNIERFYIVYFPCKKFPSKQITLIIYVMSFSIFTYIPFLFSVWPWKRNINTCLPNSFLIRDRKQLVKLLIILKYFVDGFIPFLVVLIFNMLIFYRLRRQIEQRNSAGVSEEATATKEPDDQQIRTQDLRTSFICGSQLAKRRRRFLGVTKHLTKVLGFYFILNSTYALMFVTIFDFVDNDDDKASSTKSIISELLFFLLQHLCYIKYVMNLFVYAFDKEIILNRRLLFGF